MNQILMNQILNEPILMNQIFDEHGFLNRIFWTRFNKMKF